MKRVALSLIAVLMVSLLVTVPALATPPEEASGTFQLIGPNDDGSFSFEVHGTFEGELTMYFMPGWTTRVICDPCEVDGKKGTVVFNVVLMNHNQERGNWNSLNATGELEGLHFQGKHERPLDSDIGVYHGKIHFDPQ